MIKRDHGRLRGEGRGTEAAASVQAGDAGARTSWIVYKRGRRRAGGNTELGVGNRTPAGVDTGSSEGSWERTRPGDQGRDHTDRARAPGGGPQGQHRGVNPGAGRGAPRRKQEQR